jgi:hypothetical protein
LTDQELDTKYHDLADPFLGFETANAVKQEVRSLAGGGSIQTFLNTVLDAPGHD